MKNRLKGNFLLFFIIYNTEHERKFVSMGKAVVGEKYQIKTDLLTIIHSSRGDGCSLESPTRHLCPPYCKFVRAVE